MHSRNLSTLIFAWMTSTVAHAFAVTVVTSHANPASLPTQNEQAIQRTYDLGLGRNDPVIRRNSKARKVSKPLPAPSMYDATRHLIDHQATRQYPSPQQNAERTMLLKNKVQGKIVPVKSVPKVVPIRLSGDDILKIRPSNKESAPAVAHGTPSAFDANTPWVEMLIYEQQHLALV